jgi:hypothetical protein
MQAVGDAAMTRGPAGLSGPLPAAEAEEPALCPNGDYENAAFRLTVSDVEDAAKFFLNVPHFTDGSRREANNHNVGGADGSDNFVFPVLSR